MAGKTRYLVSCRRRRHGYITAALQICIIQPLQEEYFLVNSPLSCEYSEGTDRGVRFSKSYYNLMCQGALAHPLGSRPVQSTPDHGLAWTNWRIGRRPQGLFHPACLRTRSPSEVDGRLLYSDAIPGLGVL